MAVRRSGADLANSRADRKTFMAKIDAFFNLMFEQKASDLHLSAGNNPMLRINGELQRVDYPPLDNDALKAMLYEIAPEYKIKVFEETGDVDFGYEIPNISRFRANFFNQKNGIAAVFRQIPSKVLSFEDFEKFDAPLPPVLKKFCHAAQGPGDRHRPDRFGQIHDAGGDAGLLQQEPHATTSSRWKTRSSSCMRARTAWSTSAKWACTPSRSPPACAARCAKTRTSFSSAKCATWKPLNWRSLAANTGHLVFGTLHTPSAAKTVDRIIDVFPADQQNKIRATLSESLKGVVAQNLFKRIDKKGRVAALEILVFTTAIANLVREGKTHQIPGMIQVGKRLGNQPLDDAIMEHLRMKRISPEEAYEKCLDKKKFRRSCPHPPEEDEDLTT